MYFIKLTKVLIVALLASLGCAFLGLWLFEFDYLFLPFPLLAGIGLVLVQKESVSYKFIDKLLIGSIFFGGLTVFFIFLRMYLLVPDFPFWPTYNLKEFIIFSLVFSFISLVGGLLGIVLKGFYIIYKK